MPSSHGLPPVSIGTLHIILAFPALHLNSMLKGNRQLSNLNITCLAIEAIYLNSFPIALPVAFPATRRPTRLPTLPFLTAL